MLGGKNPKRDAVGSIPVANQRPSSPYAFVTKRRRQGSVVEGSTSVRVPHTNGDMSDHGLYPCTASARDRPHRSRPSPRGETRYASCPCEPAPSMLAALSAFASAQVGAAARSRCDVLLLCCSNACLRCVPCGEI